MQIHNLPEKTSIDNADFMPVDNGTTNNKVSLTTLGRKITEDADPNYTSSDSYDWQVTKDTGWTAVSKLTPRETMKEMLAKVSLMFKNVRWLYKLIGTTDISTLGSGTAQGTITGALSKLNTDLSGKAVIETQTEASFTVAGNAATSKEFTHTKDGYNCYFLAYYEWRSSGAWWTHIKNYSINTVTIDIINQGTAFTPTTAATAWLCIKQS